jgi:omega-amidase
MQKTNKMFGVTLLQMNVTERKNDNVTNAMRMIRMTVEKDRSKMVVLPEMFTTPHGRRDLFEMNAELIPTGETCMMLANLARELKIYIVAGLPERDDRDKSIMYNTIVVFKNTGDFLVKHRQVHLVDMDIMDLKMKESDFLTPGNTLTTFDMDGVKIGLGMCCDLFYSEMATLYRKFGCDMMIYTTAYPKMIGEMFTDMLTKTRAADNQMFVMTISQARMDDRMKDMMYGHSLVVDGYGKVLKRLNDREELMYIDIDMTDLEKYRRDIKLLEHKRTDIYDLVYKK